MSLEVKAQGEKVCNQCLTPKSLSEFPRDSRNSDGRMGTCKVCMGDRNKVWQATHPQRVHDFRRARYSIDFNAMWVKQGGLCAVCGSPMLPRGKDPMSVVVDHNRNCCPSTGSCCGKCVRGLIHNRCNRVLGNARDDSDLLRQAAEYLDRWRDGLT